MGRLRYAIKNLLSIFFLLKPLFFYLRQLQILFLGFKKISFLIYTKFQIHIKPKDDITVHQKQPKREMNILSAIDQTEREPLKQDHSEKMEEAQLEKTPNESQPNVDDSALSRALKRKFTELEEITQRLRARLFDVTGNMSMDPDDEFENDLNTIPDEEDDFEESNIASSMSLDWLEHCHNQSSSNDSISFQQSMSENGMPDIFEFLSPDFGVDHSTQPNQSNPINMDFLHNKINERFNDVLNDETTGNERKDDTMKNIAETLQKSAISDRHAEQTATDKTIWN